jgi:hypothetical protein
MIGSDYLELPATWDRGQRSRWVRTGQISTLPRPWGPAARDKLDLPDARQT